MKKFVNALTIIRLISTFFLPLMWNALKPLTLIIVVSLILLTDFFDGFLARRFNVQTLFGSCLDSIADKTFGIVIVLILAKKFKLLYFVFALELFIAIINLTGSLLGATTKSSFLGKTKMWVMGLAIVAAMINVFGDEINTIFHFAFVNNKITTDIVGLMSTLTAGAQLMVATDYSRHIIKEINENHKNPKYKKIKYKLKNKGILKKALFDTDFYLKNKNQPLSKVFLN